MPHHFYLYTFSHTLTEPAFASGLSPGHTVELDGVDGFFDETLCNWSVGDVFHVLAVSGPLPGLTDSFLKLPFYRLRMLENCETWASVEVLEATTLGQWLETLPPSTGDHLPELPEKARIVLPLLVQRARAGEVAYWRSESPRWSDLSEVSALLITLLSEAPRLVVVTTNAVPSLAIHILDPT